MAKSGSGKVFICICVSATEEVAVAVSEAKALLGHTSPKVEATPPQPKNHVVS